MASRVRQLQHHDQHEEEQPQQPGEEGSGDGQEGPAGAGTAGGGKSSAQAELTDIVRAVQGYYRRRWARVDAGEGEAGAGGAEGLLADEDAVPNTSSKALAGLARQLGLPAASVRRAFQEMLRELAAELEAGPGLV